MKACSIKNKLVCLDTTLKRCVLIDFYITDRYVGIYSDAQSGMNIC